MGASFYAQTVIGMRVKNDQLYKERERQGCRCYFRGHGGFCSSCGAAMTVGEDVPVEGYDPTSEKLLTFDVVKHSYSDDAFITSVCVEVRTEGTEGKMIVPPPWNWIKQNMKEKLEPLGLWDEGSFGLWCIGHISC
jgi:hypothetical protein